VWAELRRRAEAQIVCKNGRYEDGVWVKRECVHGTTAAPALPPLRCVEVLPQI